MINSLLVEQLRAVSRSGRRNRVGGFLKRGLRIAEARDRKDHRHEEERAQFHRVFLIRGWEGALYESANAFRKLSLIWSV